MSYDYFRLSAIKLFTVRLCVCVCAIKIVPVAKRNIVVVTSNSIRCNSNNTNLVPTLFSQQCTMQVLAIPIMASSCSIFLVSCPGITSKWWLPGITNSSHIKHLHTLASQTFWPSVWWLSLGLFCCYCCCCCYLVGVMCCSSYHISLLVFHQFSLPKASGFVLLLL